MQIFRKNGSTSNAFRVTLRHSSTGQGLTGLGIASSGLIISTICDNESSATAYTVAGSTIETISTLGTFATPTATKCRFKEVDSTNHPGMYEIQLADARFAVSSAKVLRVTISGATNLLAKDVVIQLTATDIADDTVRGGLTALPNVASGSAGAIITQGTGTAQLKCTSGYVSPDWGDVANKTTANALTGTTIATTQKVDIETIKTQAVTNAAGVTFSPFVGSTGAAINGINANTLSSHDPGGTLASASAVDAVDNFVDTEIADIQARLPAALGANGNIKADLQDYLGKACPVADTAGYPKVTHKSGTGTGEISLSSGTVTVGTNNDKTGYRLSATGVDDIWDEAMSGHITSGTTGYALNEIDTIYTNAYDGINARMLANVTHISGGTPASQIRSAVGLASANLDTQLGAIDDYIDTEIASLVSSVGSLWTSALTESYRSDGSTGTGAQLLYEILSHHTEVAISGTTKTTKKIDGSTTATSLTLNSSTTPTAVSRSA